VPKQIGLSSSVGNKWPGYWIQCVLYCKLWPMSSLRLLVLDSPHRGISGVLCWCLLRNMICIIQTS
jgi:hypothetical protein